MKTIKKLNSLIVGIAIVFAVTMFIPSQAQATSWSSWSWSSYNKDNSCNTYKGSKGSFDDKSSKHSTSSWSSWYWLSYNKHNTYNIDRGVKRSKRYKRFSYDKDSTYKKKPNRYIKAKKCKKSSCNNRSKSCKKAKKYRKSEKNKGSNDRAPRASKGSCDKGSLCDKGSTCTNPTPTPSTCNECDGKVTTLTLQYNGIDDALIEVYGLLGAEVYIGTISPNETFTLDGFDRQGTLGPKIYIYVNTDKTTSIHTSCSVPILIGMDFAEFTVVDGYSRNGGQLCAIPGYEAPTPEEPQCPSDFTHLDMSIWTAGKNNSNNLQTSLSEIYIPDYPATISFVNVLTGDTNDHQQPHEQFKIVTVDDSGNVLESTNYTKDINNYTQNDELSNLGTISLVDASELILVHRADPTYGDNLSYYNSVSFKGLCYKIEETTPPEPELGNVCGTVYEDSNSDQIQNPNEKGAINLKVELIDANGDVKTVFTDNKGDYCFNNVVAGSATITVLTIPLWSFFSTNDNPNDITVIANEDNLAGKDGYIIVTP